MEITKDIKMTWNRLTKHRFDMRKIKVGEKAYLQIEEIPNRRTMFTTVSRLRDDEGNNTLRFHTVEKQPVDFSVSLPYLTEEEVAPLHSLTSHFPGRHDGWGSLQKKFKNRK